MNDLATAFGHTEALFGVVESSLLEPLAEDLYHAAQESDAPWSDAWNHVLMDILIDLGDPARAAQLDAPVDPTPLWRVAARARMATARGEPGRAIEIIEGAEVPARSNVHVRFAFAEAQAALGRKATARLEFASVAGDDTAPAYVVRRAQTRYAALAGQ